jgi:hypothetical protein
MLSPITSQSINSPAIVRWQIQQQYRIHWFLGLRQAELSVLDRTGALEYTRSTLRLSEIKKKRLQIQIESLEKIASNPLDKAREIASLDIEEKQIEIKQIDREIEKTQYQIRDAIEELTAAQNARALIVFDHQAELDNLTYSELQEVFGPQCIEAKQADSLCTEVMALSVGQPIAQLISTLEPGRSDAVLSRAIALYKSMSGLPNLISQSLPGAQNDNI